MIPGNLEILQVDVKTTSKFILQKKKGFMWSKFVSGQWRALLHKVMNLLKFYWPNVRITLKDSVTWRQLLPSPHEVLEKMQTMKMAKCEVRTLFDTIRSAVVTYTESNKPWKDDYTHLTGKSRANVVNLYFRVHCPGHSPEKKGKTSLYASRYSACIYVSNESSYWVNY